MSRTGAFVVLLAGSLGFASSLSAAEFARVYVRTSERPSVVEENVATLLAERLREPTGLAVRIGRAPAPAEDGTLTILLGLPESHTALSAQFGALRISPLTELEPGPEGFLVRLLPGGVLLAGGRDERGVLYAAGEILRRAVIGETSVTIADGLDVRTAPAFEVRGTQFGQSGVAKRLAKVRPWTDAETKRVILDYALAGANTFPVGPGPMFDLVRSFGLRTEGRFGANTGAGPPEWTAKESIGRIGYLCLSVPEAVEAQLERCRRQFRSSPTYDQVKFHGGDGGGCECDRCDPYGLTFIRVVEKMAGIIHEYHPTTKVYFTNQKFDNDDDNAIFRYLQEKPRDWLWAWGYGPGSDATTWQPGHRQTHRMDLFRYPGFGPFDLYPREILRQLPPRHALIYYNEITHWRYSQHGYIQMYPRADRNGDLPPSEGHFIYERRPDQALTMVYDRLTFFAWPRYYHRVFNDLMRYSIGDVTHSSGHHDHFNQWMWQRLLWTPRRDVEDLVDEYCRTWFGPEAAPHMARAILLLEENIEEDLSTPLARKPGIDAFYLLVKQAGWKMPEWTRKTSWLWRMFLQKGAIDKHTQLAVRQQEGALRSVERTVAEGLATGAYDDAIRDSLGILASLAPSAEMERLRAQASRLGEESNALFGVRSEGNFNLEHDFIGLAWVKRQLERARSASPAEAKELLTMVVDYENPGPGGYYDNLGTFNHAPHVVRGYPYDHGQPYVAGMLSEGNRPSQRSMHFTQDEAEGVALRYDDLDPDARYRVRFTFVRPWFQSRYAMRMNQKSQQIFADDVLLAEDEELPERMSDFFTYDVPHEVTRDGKLTLQLRKASGVAEGPRVEREQWRNSGGWGTIVSEVWLMRR